MRAVLFAVLAALAGCSFPVDEFTVQDELAKQDGGSDDADAKPAPTTTPCKCVEWDKDRCKKWSPEKCGESK